MKKKLGISIIVGVIILTCILGIIGAIYAVFSNVYAANTRDDFSFAKENGKVKKYTLELEEATAFNLILPNGVNKNDVVISEGDNNKLLKVENNVVTGIKMGSGTLKATIKIDGKTYEATTTYQIVDRDFRFPLENKSIIQYVGSNSLVVGKEFSPKLKLPSGYTMDDVEYFEDKTKLLEINDVDKSITPKKTGKGVLFAKIKGEEKYTSVNFEVIASENIKNNTTVDVHHPNNNSNTDSNNKVTNNNKSYKIQFSKKERVTTYTGKESVLGAWTPVKSGMKNTDITWSSSNPSVAKVLDSSGKVSVKGAGQTTITASYNNGGVSDHYTLIVYPKGLNIINAKTNNEITDTTITLNVGDTLQVSTNENTSKVDNNKLTYTSSNGRICSVDSNGNIKAVSKGTTTIKTMLKENNKTKGQVKVVVVGSKEEAMAKGTFSFPIDKTTNKPRELTGKSALIVGTEFSFDMVVPEGAESYPIEFTCSKKGLIEVNEEKLRAVKSGSGTLTAKIRIGTKVKTATTKIQVLESQEEKDKAEGSEVKYLNINFDKEIMAVQVGNVINLKPIIETNMSKKEYTLEYKASKEGMVELNKNTGRVKPLKSGKVDITVAAKEKPGTEAVITLDIQEKVVLVSALQLATELPKNKGYYQLTAGEPYNIQFDVLPESATLQDYSLEVEDTENFIVTEKTITALKAGVKTKVTAKALDSGNKKATINVESVISESELNSLSPILDNKEIIVKIGETLKLRNVQDKLKTTITKATKNNFTLKYDEEVVTIVGKSEGNGNITVKYGKEKVVIPVKVVKNTEEKKVEETPVTKIAFPIDQNTAKTKDYVNDHQFVVGECYKVSEGVTVLPLSATNKDVTVSVSDNNAFTVTPEGNVIANEPNKEATLKVASVSNPEVYSTVRLASVGEEIASIRFPRKYIGDDHFDINDNNHPWAFGMIITTTGGKTYNPLEDYSVTQKDDYKRLRNQLVIESSNKNILSIKNNEASPIKGVNGSGTLTAYVKSNPSIRDTTPFEVVGADSDVTISKVKFAQDTYNLSVEEGSTSFCPIITLSTGRVLDPRKSSVKNSAEYKSYLSQLKLVKIAGLKNQMLSTGRLVSIVRPDEGLIIEIGWAGKCEIGIALKNSNNVIAKTVLDISDKSEEADEKDEIKAEITEIDHATTTNNKNLKITNIQFAQKSYTLDETYGWGFNPEITLSDSTKLSSKSQNQDVYKYYLGLTELLLTNDSNASEIDFGVLDVVNTEVPRQVVPLKDGKVTLAVAVKSTGIIYDRIPITVKLKK